MRLLSNINPLVLPWPLCQWPAEEVMPINDPLFFFVFGQHTAVMLHLVVVRFYQQHCGRDFQTKTGEVLLPKQHWLTL